MSKCPFWSKKNDKVSCNCECPMHPAMNNEEICPFIEVSLTTKIISNEYIEDDFAYTQDNLYDFSYSALGNYQ